jgi:threonine synthase
LQGGWADYSGVSRTLTEILQAEADQISKVLEQITQPILAARDAVLQFAERYQGSFITVDEENILPGRDQLAHLGFYVEATSALVWLAMSEVVGVVPDPLVVILTGHGLKYRNS